MKYEWTAEKLAALAPDRLESLRKNAVIAQDEQLIAACAELQLSRKPAPKPKAAPKSRSKAALAAAAAEAEAAATAAAAE